MKETQTQHRERNMGAMCALKEWMTIHRNLMQLPSASQYLQ